MSSKNDEQNFYKLTSRDLQLYRRQEVVVSSSSHVNPFDKKKRYRRRFSLPSFFLSQINSTNVPQLEAHRPRARAYNASDTCLDQILKSPQTTEPSLPNKKTTSLSTSATLLALPFFGALEESDEGSSVNQHSSSDTSSPPSCASTSCIVGSPPSACVVPVSSATGIECSACASIAADKPPLWMLLQRTINSSAAQPLFDKFLKREFCSENLEFLSALCKLKLQGNLVLGNDVCERCSKLSRKVTSSSSSTSMLSLVLTQSLVQETEKILSEFFVGKYGCVLNLQGELVSEIRSLAVAIRAFHSSRDDDASGSSCSSIDKMTTDQGSSTRFELLDEKRIDVTKLYTKLFVLFNEVEENVFQLLLVGPFPRFLKSDLFCQVLSKRDRTKILGEKTQGSFSSASSSCSGSSATMLPSTSSSPVAEKQSSQISKKKQPKKKNSLRQLVSFSVLKTKAKRLFRSSSTSRVSADESSSSRRPVAASSSWRPVSTSSSRRPVAASSSDVS
mmetsp:Transcript_6041/g.9397  ORF Transcript_6041/g.9397 Transcript_6041/m.9397 type:complete len:504 (+) Transcript_6041:38-1549(+)|eukprot:CAMPEP_0201562472 /NCGR_PEP_ID=MMETSP0173_2-20130828/79347_1 /ASSEMBLY_ACC=CAM_ASM_000268 /TAXON_ID=218659 /ORGANISM="Vexillifera sp., Strain DIVA3 564/2" /LENGTH=503 /DNA_ID=CAMNT_0047977043 /DNA_START=16 /DNA_END=1527 /DNA_ORIENTATION=+